MDAVINDASKVAHLPAEKVPALPYYHDATYLREKAFPVCTLDFVDLGLMLPASTSTLS